MARFRRWTPAMSTPSGSARTPKDPARATSDATFAPWMTFLLGKQATFGHEPPTIARSTSAVRWPSFDNVQARYLPASPLPMTRTSYRSIVAIVLPPADGRDWRGRVAFR